MSRSSRDSVVRSLVVLSWAVLGLGFAVRGVVPASEPSSLSREYELALPTDTQARRFWDSTSERAPARLKALAEATGVVWSAVWDPVLDVPDLAFPQEPFSLGAISPDVSPASAAALAAEFLSRHRDVLGVGPEGLTELSTSPFGTGYHVSAVQSHGGLPVRGSSFRLRLNGDGTLRSVGTRVSRELPPVATVAWTDADGETWAQRAIDEDGFQQVLLVEPRILFPAGIESAVPGVIVAGIDAEGREVLLYRSLPDGEWLGTWETAVGFEDEPGEGAGCAPGSIIDITISADGFCPNPKDYYTIPPAYDPVTDRYPIPALYVLIEPGIPCPNHFTWQLDDMGLSETNIEDQFSETNPYKVAMYFDDTRIRFKTGLSDYIELSFQHEGSLVWGQVYNSRLQKVEFEAAHLLVYHHLHRSARRVLELVTQENVRCDWRPYDKRLTVTMENQQFRHGYLVTSGGFWFASDELQPKDEAGRWRKITPTIVCHEYGHEFVEQVARANRDTLLVQGVADAFATYMARASRIGYDHEGNPTAESDRFEGLVPAARDLRYDRDALHDLWDARPVVAGALWEVWEATRVADPGEQDISDGKSTSAFAWSVLTRWLGSRRNQGDVGVLPYDPYLGVGFWLEADDDGDPRNGVPGEDALFRAFGRRNLFPLKFLRGDANQDGNIDLSDAVRALDYLFLGGAEPACADAMDSDDSGEISLTDPIRLLNHLFLGGEPLPEPTRDLAADPTPWDGLGCAESFYPFVYGQDP